jgi:hypothetical protein
MARLPMSADPEFWFATVKAGCRPANLPVLLAAVNCARDPALNLHGMSASIRFAALTVVNGPIRTRIGVNASFGVFSPGCRANAMLGRALRLLMIKSEHSDVETG